MPKENKRELIIKPGDDRIVENGYIKAPDKVTPPQKPPPPLPKPAEPKKPDN